MSITLNVHTKHTPIRAHVAKDDPSASDLVWLTMSFKGCANSVSIFGAKSNLEAIQRAADALNEAFGETKVLVQEAAE